MYTVIGLVWLIFGFVMLLTGRAFEEIAVSFLVAAVFFILRETTAFRMRAEKKWEDKVNGRIPEGNILPFRKRH